MRSKSQKVTVILRLFSPVMKPGEKGGNSKSGGELASDANNSGGIIIFLPVKVLFTNQKREKLTVDKCINLN